MIKINQIKIFSRYQYIEVDSNPTQIVNRFLFLKIRKSLDYIKHYLRLPTQSEK